MTRLQAIEILTAWKAGSEAYPPAIITAALIATGDIDARLYGEQRIAALKAGLFTDAQGKS